MSVSKLFDTIDKAREAADWRAAFGAPQAFEDRTVIPVARVGYGFGLGFGSGTAAEVEESEPTPSGEGGGGGGTSSAKPLGAIVVTPERVYFEAVRDDGKIAVVALGMVALNVWQIAKTLRAIFGK